MSSSFGPNSESGRSRLRATVATLEREAELLPVAPPGEDGHRSPDRLRESIADLSVQLDLGPEPELRDCPACGRSARREASRCGHCWATLPPLR